MIEVKTHSNLTFLTKACTQSENISRLLRWLSNWESVNTRGLTKENEKNNPTPPETDNALSNGSLIAS